MPSLPLTIVGTPLSPTWTGTIEQFHQAVLSSITAQVSDTSNLILGKIGGSAPVSDIGPWLDTGSGGIWKYWSGSAYVPVALKIGTGSNLITLTGTPTAARTITFQDKDGTVALTSDIYTPRNTVTLSSSSPATVDWSQAESFKDAITVDKSYVMSNSLPGQKIFIAVYNNSGSSRVITWPDSVQMLVGASVAVTTTVANTKTDLYILRNVGGSIYGQALQGY